MPRATYVNTPDCEELDDFSAVDVAGMRAPTDVDLQAKPCVFLIRYRARHWYFSVACDQ